ncbi:hypothetical protein Tco_0591174 [Tanacetum coccineum]
MGRDTIQLDDDVSTISEEYLLEFTSEYGIPEDLHPELPGTEDTVVDFPEGKVGVYTKFFEFANYRIPLSQFLFDILGYYQIHLSQLSVIGAAKVGHFEITCRVLNIIPTLNLFRVFYIPSYNAGWMSFSKRPGKNTPQCYTKPLDSLKNWNNRFFWVDEKVFPTVVAWRTGAPKDGMPPAGSYSALDVTTLNTRRTPIQKQPELLLCLVGLSRRYFLGDDVYPTFLYDDDREMDLFNLISAPNPAKVKTGTRPRAAHEVPLLTATANRVIDMDTTGASGSSGTPSTVEKSPLDFADEDLPPPNTEGVGTEEQVQDELSREIPPVGHASTAEVIPETGVEEEVATMRPPVNKRRKQMRRKRTNDEAEANAPPKVLSKYHVSNHAHSAYGGKYLAAMGLGAGSISSTPSVQGAPTAAKSVSDPDPLSYGKPQPYLEQDIAQSSRGTATEIPIEHVATTEVNVQLSVESPESGRSTFVPSVVGSPEGIYQPGWGVTNDCRLDTLAACQDTMDHIVPPGYFSKLRHLPNADFLSQYNMNLSRQVAMGSQLRLRFEQEVRLLKKARAKIVRRDQRIQVRKEEIKKLDQEVRSIRATETEVHGLRNQTKNLETLLEAEADMKKATEAKNTELTKELESLHITGEEETKAAFERFKKYKDDRVDQRCAEMDARLDALSIDFDEELYPHMLTAIAGVVRVFVLPEKITSQNQAALCGDGCPSVDKLSVDFDEELYPHMLTAIAGHRWVIGHGLPLAVMKCAESAELRQVFANVVSAGIAKRMSEGLKYGIEHGKANRDLVDVEAYDPEANDKLVKALQDLKDLEYLMVDQLERQKDAPMKLIIASLHLEGDTGEYAPQRIRDLRPSSSQLKIPVYPEVRNPKDPWAVKEEMMLEDAIAANISQAENKKKCRVVCRTYRIG